MPMLLLEGVSNEHLRASSSTEIEGIEAVRRVFEEVRARHERSQSRLIEDHTHKIQSCVEQIAVHFKVRILLNKRALFEGFLDPEFPKNLRPHFLCQSFLLNMWSLCQFLSHQFRKFPCKTPKDRSRMTGEELEAEAAGSASPSQPQPSLEDRVQAGVPIASTPRNPVAERPPSNTPSTSAHAPHEERVFSPVRHNRRAAPGSPYFTGMDEFEEVEM